MTLNLKRQSSSVANVIVAIAVFSSVLFVALIVLFLRSQPSSSAFFQRTKNSANADPSKFEQIWRADVDSTNSLATIAATIRDYRKINNDSDVANVDADADADADADTAQKELIRPVKIEPITSLLFQEELIIDHRNENGSRSRSQSHNRNTNVFSHNSGNFRRNKAKIWDPHPEYQFRAFGQLFHLILKHDSEFAHPSLKVTVVSKNLTFQREPDVNPSGCYYSGFLLNQPHSNVVVSLCNGMTGHINGENGSYFVEPASRTLDLDMDDTFEHVLYLLDSRDSTTSDDKPCEWFENEDTTKHLTVLHNDGSFGSIKDKGKDRDEDDRDDDDVVVEEREEDHLGVVIDDGANYAGKYERNLTAVHLQNVRPPMQRRKKRSAAASTVAAASTIEPIENVVELMIAADDSMSQYHGSGLHNYILTLMSMVNKIFKDESIGNPIRITVVKLVMVSDPNMVVTSQLYNEVKALTVTLENFCKWQKNNNHYNDLHPEHHDCALLLFREIACKSSNATRCYDKLGLAQLGTMCQRNCCAIIRDNGLATAFTIAHELGHLFNMPHDEDDSCNHSTEKGLKKRVMTRQLGPNTHPWKWSACSKHFLTEFLDMGNDFCLHDDPFSDYLTGTSDEDSWQLPGEMYGQDEQCEMMYGKGHKICSYANCGNLLCSDDEKNKGCYSRRMPAAEGTPCGTNRWCQQGECVPMDRRSMNPVHGGWSSWQPFGECSRSCGGGIKRAYRNCDNPSPINGGKFCLGKRVKYESCNFKECPIGTLDFRSQQCAEFNNNSLPIHNLTSENVRWVAYHLKGNEENRNERCQLFCALENKPSVHYRFKDTVVDGTACEPNSFDMCVNGVCMKAGCDHILNSNSVLDVCGICGGDGTSCRKVRKQFNLLRVKYGYNNVATIPAGASNINIQQRASNDTKDENYLVLVDAETGQNVLNTNFIITTFGKKIDYDGVTIDYSGSNAVIERINTSQPLRKDLSLQVLSVAHLNPPEIVCEYTVPISPQDYFTWHVTDKWSHCDKVCNGVQKKITRCTRKDTNNYVSEESCHGLPKPEEQIKVCNQHCILRWNLVSQSECSSHCGPGFRNLTFRCFQEFVNIILPHRYLPDASCEHIEKPLENQTCMGACDSYHWKYDEWSPCNVSCGSGIQTRRAICVDNAQHPVDHAKCAASEKIVRKVCATQKKCSRWSSGEWSQCSVTCGVGRKTRVVRCQQGNRVVPPFMCASNEKPSPTESCESSRCDAAASDSPSASASRATDTEGVADAAGWIAGTWSDCSSSCGSGFKTRTVRCNLPDQRLCANKTKPISIKACSVSECSSSPNSAITFNTAAAAVAVTPADQTWWLSSSSPSSSQLFIWLAGDWQPCSSTCGTAGVRRRVVSCFNVKTKTVANRSKCDLSEMPTVQESCAPIACSTNSDAAKWTTTEWSSCSVSCGIGTSVRNVWCESNAVQVAEYNCVQIKPPHSMKCDTSKSCSTYGGGGNLLPSLLTSVSAPMTVSAPKSTITPTSTTTTTTTTTTSLTATATPPLLLPNLSKSLPLSPSISGIWRTGRWEECSVTCGFGVQKRSVRCELEASSENDEKLIMPDKFCSNVTQPPTHRQCTMDSCSRDYEWMPERWSQCNASCGAEGRQKRKLACLHRNGKKVRKSFCRFKRKPARKRKCKSDKCEPNSCSEVRRIFKTRVDREYSLNILGRNISIYCHRMDTDYPLEYLSLLSGNDENYSEFFDKRLINPNSCPEYHENWTPKQYCPCLENSSNTRSGKTVFRKIRLNVSSLQVDTNDFTFSEQTSGSAVIPYGEAGDCFSAANCPQGTFSINLKGTGLRVASSTSWITDGTNATMRIRFSQENRKVVAKCGGYCAVCRPVQFLKLDILPP